MLDDLFVFPVIMIDGDNEEKKQKNKHRFGDISSDEGEEYDMVQGEAEYPYYDFLGIEDRWLPSTASLDKALRGKFEACIVRFNNVGQLLVPWTKKKFKVELMKFIEKYESTSTPKDKLGTKVLTLNPKQLKNLTDIIDSQDE